MRKGKWFDYGVLYLPTLYFVDPLGNLAGQVIGAQEESVCVVNWIKFSGFEASGEASKNLVELTSEVVILDFRKESANPFPDRKNISYQVVDGVDSVISSFLEGFTFLLTENNVEGLETGKALASLVFQRFITGW